MTTKPIKTTTREGTLNIYKGTTNYRIDLDMNLEGVHGHEKVVVRSEALVPFLELASVGKRAKVLSPTGTWSVLVEPSGEKRVYVEVAVEAGNTGPMGETASVGYILANGIFHKRDWQQLAHEVLTEMKENK